jgi:hypothetical protein
MSVRRSSSGNCTVRASCVVRVEPFSKLRTMAAVSF